MTSKGLNDALKAMNGARAENVTGVQRTPTGQLIYPGEIRRYILGGNSCFTLVNTHTGERRTYKVKSATRNREANWSTGNQDRSTYFVSFRSGPGDSFSDYSYLGMLVQGGDGAYRLKETSKSKARKGSVAFNLIDFAWHAVEVACRVPSWLEFYHEGSCCMCGRKLTVPESIASGIGPECEGKAGL